MKLSSASLTIAAALATIASSVTAVPVPRPFERDVNIYSRAHELPATHGDPHELTAAHQEQRALEAEHEQKCVTAAEVHYHAAYSCWDTSNLAKEKGYELIAAAFDAAKDTNLLHMRHHTVSKYDPLRPYPLETTTFAIKTLQKAVAIGEELRGH